MAKIMDMKAFPRRRINQLTQWAIDQGCGAIDKRRALRKRAGRKRSQFRRLRGEGLETRRVLAVISIAAANADRDEGDSGVTPFTFEVSRIGDTTGSATVNYSVFGSGGDPANVDDFNGNVLPTGQVIFFAGQSSKTLTINISGDRFVENDETFTVNLSNPSDDSTIATASASGTIRDDDAPPPATLSIAANNADRNEGSSGVTPFTFTVARTGNTSGSTTVDYAVTGSGSQPADVDDFNGNVLPIGQVVFLDGQSSRTLTVNVSGDLIVEDDESFLVTLSNPSGNTIIDDESATGIIRDDDQPPSPSLEIVATNADRDEGDAGLTPFVFTVTRDDNTTDATTVDYSVVTTGSNAADIDDFNGNVLPNGRVTFFSGQVSQTITVNVTGDFINEADETFTVMLSNPTGQATITKESATGTIRDDDQTAPPTLAISAIHSDRDEGDDGTTQFQFAVARDGNTSEVVLASYTVVGSGTNPANAGDFFEGSLPSGSVVFAAGESSQTLSIPVGGDVILEPDETFLVVLSDPTGGATISFASAMGVIRNDDSAAVPRLAITPATADQSEGDVGTTLYTFNVTRSDVTSGLTLVNYAVSATGSNSADADDFDLGIFPSGSVQFNDGEVSKTISIAVGGDLINEFDEFFAVTLSNPTGEAIITDGTAIGVIRNDDSAEVPTLSIEATNADRIEGSSGVTEFVFTVTRDGELTGTASASYTVVGSGNQPAIPNDFVGGVYPDGTVTFVTGETVQKIVVSVAGDTLAESDETFTVSLVDPIGDTTIIDATATGVIRDDDTAEANVNIIHPDSVAQVHTIDSSSFPNAIIFRALENSTISVEPIGFNLSAGAIRILDSDTNVIGNQTGNATTASLSGGQTYAIVFPSQATQRRYSIDSSAGADALTTQATTNLFRPTDSTANGTVTALDALVVINYLNEFGVGTIGNATRDDYYLDVNGDNVITAVDALTVINRLNESDQLAAQASSESEPIVALPSRASHSIPISVLRDNKSTRNDRAIKQLFEEVGRRAKPDGGFDDSVESLVRPLLVTDPEAYDLALKNSELDADLAISFRDELSRRVI